LTTGLPPLSRAGAGLRPGRVRGFAGAPCPGAAVDAGFRVAVGFRSAAGDRRAAAVGLAAVGLAAVGLAAVGFAAAGLRVGRVAAGALARGFARARGDERARAIAPDAIMARRTRTRSGRAVIASAAARSLPTCARANDAMVPACASSRSP
jgi:hypothetical protein